MYEEIGVNYQRRKTEIQMSKEFWQKTKLFLEYTFC